MVALGIGFLIVFGAVGGIENSQSNTEVLQAFLLTFPGFALMLLGLNQIKKG